MSRAPELVGKTFGRWTVVSRAPNRGTAAQWVCECSCGASRIVLAGVLRRGKSKSCGCYQAELTSARFTKHGASRRGGTSEYNTWAGMNGRCHNPNEQWFKIYGGKGVRICDRWSGSEGFTNFLADMGYKPSDQHSIERIDGDGNYEPSNCIWATKVQQSRNTSRNRYLTYNDETHCLAEWAEIRGIPRKTLTARLRYGWPLNQALEFDRRVGKNIKYWESR